MHRYHRIKTDSVPRQQHLTRWVRQRWPPLRQSDPRPRLCDGWRIGWTPPEAEPASHQLQREEGESQWTENMTKHTKTFLQAVLKSSVIILFSLLGPAKPGSRFHFQPEPEASRVKKTQISLRRRKILLVHCSQEEEPTSPDGTSDHRVCVSYGGRSPGPPSGPGWSRCTPPDSPPSARLGSPPCRSPSETQTPENCFLVLLSPVWRPESLRDFSS